MKLFSAYWRLMRMDKPIGILLLWWPTAWALWVANDGMPNYLLLIVFLLGTIMMRSAGCVINDIADKDIDIHVKRTQARPLTSGELTYFQAIFLLCLLLLFAVSLLLFLPRSCFGYALVAVGLSFFYPLTKRFLKGPQFILGLAFSMGIPMAFSASGKSPNSLMFLILLINYFWIVAYDTQYALMDREDDRLIGVRSTALFFEPYEKLIIGIFQILFHLAWLALPGLSLSFGFIICWILAGCVLIYQQMLLRSRTQERFLKAFLSNNWYGLIMWVGLVLK